MSTSVCVIPTLDVLQTVVQMVLVDDGGGEAGKDGGAAADGGAGDDAAVMGVDDRSPVQFDPIESLQL